jgi:putative flippase GtrA
VAGIIGQFVSFTGVGAIGTLAHYGTLISLVKLFSMRPLTASSVGFITGAAINYLLNYRYTFASERPHREASWRFLSVAGAGLLLNSAVVALATEILDQHYLLAQVLATGLVLIWNFTGNRLWTFK